MSVLSYRKTRDFTRRVQWSEKSRPWVLGEIIRASYCQAIKRLKIGLTLVKEGRNDNSLTSGAPHSARELGRHDIKEPLRKAALLGAGAVLSCGMTINVRLTNLFQVVPYTNVEWFRGRNREGERVLLRARFTSVYFHQSLNRWQE